MVNFVYCEAITEMMNAAGQDLDAGGTTLKLMLVMTNTTADTEEDVNTVAGFTTLDEYAGAGYTSGGVTLTTKALIETAGGGAHTGKTTLDADDVTYTALVAGARQIQAAVLIRWTGTTGDSIPLAYYEPTGFPFTADGGDRTVRWPAGGFYRGRQNAT